MRGIAPRISPRLLRELERLAESDLGAAEVTRLVGERADALALPRPSYQRVRMLVREHRARPWRPSTAEVVVDVAMRVRPHDALVEHFAGIQVPEHPHR